MTKPPTHEYAPYYQRYIDLVADGDFFALLDENTADTLRFFGGIDPARHNYRYAENKWTIKDVLMHCVDTERGFSYRAIVCVRGDDRTPLYPMDEDFYAANVDTTERSMDRILEEFLAVRAGFRQIFAQNPDEKFALLGNGQGHKISARALGYIALGHVAHHANVVQERYFQ
jgi:uncharacterized damage-inducible protein DinB